MFRIKDNVKIKRERERERERKTGLRLFSFDK